MARPRIIQTKEVEKYIDENWQNFLHREIAEHLNVRETMVSAYCIKKGYKKYLKNGNQEPSLVKTPRLSSQGLI